MEISQRLDDFFFCFFLGVFCSAKMCTRRHARSSDKGLLIMIQEDKNFLADMNLPKKTPDPVDNFYPRTP